MSFALTEVEATVRKAARGAGHSWGMAEEAGKAARWLCAAGLDGCAAMALVLCAADKQSPETLAPVGLRGEWHGPAGAICPLMTGAALSDSVDTWKDSGLRIKDVMAPVVLLAFAAGAAHALGAPVTVVWDGVEAVTNGAQVSLKITDGTSPLDPAPLVTLRKGGTLGQPQANHSRANPQATDWTALNAMAERIYAPVTEESRLKGAGAGLSDND